jgi:hypothetical protein
MSFHNWVLFWIHYSVYPWDKLELKVWNKLLCLQ